MPRPDKTAPLDGAVSLRSAASLAAGEPLKLGAALGILRDVAEALDRLHARGAAHGAVCAENIVLDAKGVARLCHDTLQPPRASPELRGGSRPDARCDVYGLGAAIQELLGEAPALPMPIERLLATMTADDPARRYQSMADVLTALEACELMTGCRAFRPGHEPGAGGPTRQGLLTVVLLLALGVLAIALMAVLSKMPRHGGAEPDLHKELTDSPRPATAKTGPPATK